MAQNFPLFQHPLLKIGSIALLAGTIIVIISTILHVSTEEPDNHLLVLTTYVNDDSWIAVLIGQFAGVVMVFAMVASLAAGSIFAISPVFADKDYGSNGLERADENVHENAIQNDVTFHKGLCQGGHSTEALDNLGGCDILTDPGNSDDHRQD